VSDSYAGIFGAGEKYSCCERFLITPRLAR